jgi:hypothetical protein
MCIGIPLILMAASAAVSAYGAYNTAKGQQQQLDYQGKVADVNAKRAEFAAQDAEERGQRESQQARQRANAMTGAQRASLAARGMDLTGGSALSLLEDTEYLGAVDQTTITNNTNKEAWRLRNQREDYQSSAQANRTGAGNVNPGLSLATSLVNSGSSVASSWDKYKAGSAGSNPWYDPDGSYSSNPRRKGL